MEIVDKEAETKDTDYFSREGVINGTNVKHSVFAANDNLEFNIAGLDGIVFGADYSSVLNLLGLYHISSI